MVVSNCKKSSILECFKCEDYQCKNLWGPIKKDSRCYKMIQDKLFDECIFGCENENDYNGCSRCEYADKCSNLIRESVVFMDIKP